MITTTKTCASYGDKGQSLVLTLAVSSLEARSTSSLTFTLHSVTGKEISTQPTIPIVTTPSIIWLASTRTVKPVKALATDGGVSSGGAGRNEGVVGAVVGFFGAVVLVV